jgi:hypothetical protein
MQHFALKHTGIPSKYDDGQTVYGISQNEPFEDKQVSRSIGMFSPIYHNTPSIPKIS